MSILALDLGTTTGWALKVDGKIHSGTWSFKNGRFEGGGMRFLRFRQKLEEVRACLDINTVYFEEVRNHKGVDASHVYGGMMGTLTAWCEEQSIPYSGVSVGTIKKSLTGKGNANKEKMILAVQELGYKPIDDNEADAIAILLCKERAV